MKSGGLFNIISEECSERGYFAKLDQNCTNGECKWTVKVLVITHIRPLGQANIIYSEKRIFLQIRSKLQNDKYKWTVPASLVTCLRLLKPIKYKISGEIMSSSD